MNKVMDPFNEQCHSFRSPLHLHFHC